MFQFECMGYNCTFFKTMGFVSKHGDFSTKSLFLVCFISKNQNIKYQLFVIQSKQHY